MRKNLFFILLFAVSVFFCVNAKCQITEHKSTSNTKVRVASYPEYKPFSYTYDEYNMIRRNIFEEAVNSVLKESNVELEYMQYEDYNKNIDNFQNGKIDIMFGIYNETQTDVKLFDNTDYLFPALIYNQVNLVMLPENKDKIKNMDDLKNLKGLYLEEDFLTDYVYSKMEEYGVQKEKDSYLAYKKLFLGEADYIIGSYYFHYVKTLELGLKDFVSFSKKPLWSMPMFIGLSKASGKYNRLKTALYKKVTDPKMKTMVEKSLKQYIRDIEEKSIGVVPPTFVSEYSKVIIDSDKKEEK